jgi:hypothetical protein
MQTYSGNPQALQQRYAQTQELVDLLALQKMKNDRAAATSAVQGAMQTPSNTVKGQLEQEAMQGSRNDVLRSMAPGIQQQGQRMAQMQNRAAMGLPTQAAPNMARMANGGIVGYADGGSVDLLGAALEAEGITDPATINLIRSIYAQESSSGQDTRVSPAGARGPMQVMPTTFTEMMGPDADINDPMTNLRAGSRYAQRMLQKAGGDPRLAAAAYYGGPDEIAKLRAGIDTQAPQKGFPSVSEYANQIVNRAGSAERAVGDNPTGRLGDYTGDLEAAGIDPDFFASTYREGVEKGARPPSPSVVQVPGVGTVPIPSAKAREIGRTPRETVGKSGEELFLDSRLGEAFVSPRDREARLEELRKDRAFQSAAPLGDRVPSKDASRAVGGDPLNVQGMVDRLVAPPFRTQGILRDAEPTDRQRFAKALGLPLKDFEQKAPPPKKKRMFDNVDIGRLQAFLAGGGGQTSTAGALGGGLRGLMGEDQRREALASKEGIEAAKIASQRYGIEQDYNAALAKLGFDKQKMVFDAQSDMLKERFKAEASAVKEAMDRIENNSEYQKEFMRLSAEYGDNPARLGAELTAVTSRIARDDVDIQRLLRDGEGAGAFEVELPSGD